MSLRKFVGRQVEIIYMDKTGRFSKRIVDVIAARDGKVLAYCHASKAIRSFREDQILAAVPERRHA